MKRVIVHLQDESGRESVFATEPMNDEVAEAERTRIEEEHANAGDRNRWIRVGGTSVQSKHLVTIRVEDPPLPPRGGGLPITHDLIDKEF